MNDKVWGAIPMPAVFAKEANLLADGLLPFYFAMGNRILRRSAILREEVGRIE